MLKTIPLILETMQCPINKPQWRLPGTWEWENIKFDKTFRKPWHNSNLYIKSAKFRDNKMLKTNPFLLPQGHFLAREAG